MFWEVRPGDNRVLQILKSDWFGAVPQHCLLSLKSGLGVVFCEGEGEDGSANLP